MAPNSFNFAPINGPSAVTQPSSCVLERSGHGEDSAREAARGSPTR